jgi:hypothetical protein
LDSSFGVCSAHPRNEAVAYRLQISSSTPTTVATEYIVDWGDGQTTQNSAPAGEQVVMVSHSYDTAGSYTVTFRLSSSGTILAQREVCVQ